MSRTRLFLRGFSEGFRSVGQTISMVINTVLLCFVYFVGVGLAVVVTKVVGIQVLSLGKKTKGSYYVNKKIGKGSMDEYRNQF